MPDKVQITPLITPFTREALRSRCQEKGCSQGDIVEQALVAFLEPLNLEDTLQQLAYEQGQLASIQRDMKEMLERLINAIEALPPGEPPPVPAPKVPIATYAQMYGPLAEDAPAVAEPPVVLPPARSSRLRRWFLREVSA